MSQKLDNRQVYDPETESGRVPKTAPDDGLEEAYDNSLGNDDVARGIAEAELHSGTSAGNESASSADEDSLQKTGNDMTSESSATNKKGTGGLRGKITKKKSLIGGGLTGLLIAAIIATAGIVSGPLKILQFANLLERFHLSGNSSLTEGRLGNFYRYLRYPNSAENRRVGAIARRSSANIEAEFKSRGLTPVWDKGRMLRFEVNPADLPALRSAGLGPNIIDVNGTYRIDIDPPGTSARVARANLGNVKDVVRSLDVKVGAIGMRNLRTKAGVGFLDNSVRRLGQNVNATIAEKIEDYKSKRAADVESGDTRVKVDITQESEVDADGNTEKIPVDNIDIEGGKTGARAKVDAAKSGATKGLAVVGLACAAYTLVDAASALRQSNVVQPLMRFGMRALTISSQIQAGGGAVDFEALGMFSADMFDETAAIGAKSWREAASIQSNLGEQVTGVTIPNSAHPTNGGSFIIDAFNSIPGFVGKGVGTICGAVNSIVGQAVSYAIGFTPAGFVTDVAGDLIVAQIVDRYADDLVAILAGEMVDTSTFLGGILGAAADFGVMLSAGETMLSLGGRALSPFEVGELNQYYAQQRHEDIKKQNVFERYFALSNPESLFAQSVTATASLSSPSRVVDNVSSGTYASSLMGTFSSLFVNKTYAQTTSSFSYDVDLIGFSLDEQNDPRYQNPFENENIAVATIQDNKEKINNCFGLELGADNSLAPIKDAVRLVSNERKDQEGCNDTDEEWTRIRFYIADNNIATSYDCSQGNEESCEEVGFADVQGSTAPGTTTGSVGPITIEGNLAFPLAVTKSQVGGDFSNGTTGQAGHPYIAYDLLADEGTTTVSMTDGVVVRVSNACEGNTAAITINVPDQGISIWYGHQDPATVLVSEGQTVTAGTPLSRLVNSSVDCMSGADHLHIDANRNIGADIYRPGCSRKSCTDAVRNRFLDIGPQLYELYQALPD